MNITNAKTCEHTNVQIYERCVTVLFRQNMLHGGTLKKLKKEHLNILSLYILRNDRMTITMTMTMNSTRMDYLIVYLETHKITDEISVKLLSQSIQRADLSEIKFLLEYGLNIHSDVNDFLLHPILNCNIECVDLLLEMGADINVNNCCLFCKSIMNNNLSSFNLLLERGIDYRRDDDFALKLSASYGHTEMFKILFERGANPLKTRDDLLYMCSRKDYVGIINILLETNNYTKERLMHH